MSILFAAVGGQGGVVVPGAPGTLSLSAGSTPATEIDLSWSAPSDTGGGTISGYRIKKDGSVLVADTSSTGTTYTATGLTRVTSYNFTVAAINEKGTGADGNTPSLTTSAEVPGAPGTLSLAAGTPSYSAINLSWSAPSDTGGATITGYRIKKDGSVLVADTSSTGTTYTATGLTGGTSYNFNTAAINSIGTGADSNTPSLTTGLSPAGYSCGGYGPSFSTVDTVFKYSFSGDSWSTSSSTLNEAVRGGMGAQNDGTAGYMFGGYTTGRRNTVKKLLFSSDATSVITATMAQGRIYGGSNSSATKAYQVGGNQTSPQWNSDGQVLLFSNETISTLSSMLSDNKQSLASISSIADGYGWSFAGYYVSGSAVYPTTTDKVQFSNDTISLDTGDIPSGAYAPTGMSNDGTAGYMLGGNDGSRVDTVFKMPFSSSTWSTLGATLSEDLDSAGPTSVNLKDNFGLMCGGLPNSGSISTTNKMTFSSDSRSTGAALPADRAVTYAFQNQGL